MGGPLGTLCASRWSGRMHRKVASCQTFMGQLPDSCQTVARQLPDSCQTVARQWPDSQTARRKLEDAPRNKGRVLLMRDTVTSMLVAVKQAPC